MKNFNFNSKLIFYINFWFIFIVPVVFQHSTFSLTKVFPTVAVLDFKDNSPLATNELKPLQAGLAEMMITTLAHIQQLKVVERQQLQALIQEISLGQTGLIDPASAQKVGRLLGAQYLVLGSFIKGFKEDIRIDCRIVKTETGETIKAEEVSGKLNDILKLMSQLSQKVVKNLDIRFSALEMKKIKQTASGCNYEIVELYFKAIELIDQKKYQPAETLLKKITARCPEFQAARKTRHQLGRRLQKME